MSKVMESSVPRCLVYNTFVLVNRLRWGGVKRRWGVSIKMTDRRHMIS